MTLKDALNWGRKKLDINKINSAFLDAEILLSYISKKPREWVMANDKKNISQKTFERFQKLILRRAKKEPIAYIIGKKEFYGLDFIVDKNVLIPRPETEILVKEALKYIRLHLKSLSQISILDLGTGSGCISIAIAKKIKITSQRLVNRRLKIFASDISPKALKIARKNAQKYKMSKKIKFIKSDLFQNISQKIKFDIIIANLPYLSQKILIQNRELKFEPKNALLGGKNGLQIYQKFLRQVPKHLKPNSKIFIEIGDNQKNAIKKIIKQKLPQKKITLIKDLSNKNRVVLID